MVIKKIIFLNIFSRVSLTFIIYLSKCVCLDQLVPNMLSTEKLHSSLWWRNYITSMHRFFYFYVFFCFLGGPFFFSDRLAVKRGHEEEVRQQKAAGWMWTRAAAFQPEGIWAPAQPVSWQPASATHNMVKGRFSYPLKKKKSHLSTAINADTISK